MAFKSTKGSGVTWNPKKDADGGDRVKATENDYLDGYYVNRKDNIGEHDSTVFTIQKDDGTDTDVWGDTVLVSEMEKIRLGSYVRLQWHGKKLKKQYDKPGVKFTQTNSFHNWEVFVDDEVAPLASAANKNDFEPAQPKAGAPAKGATAGNVFAKKNAANDDDGDDLPF